MASRKQASRVDGQSTYRVTGQEAPSTRGPFMSGTVVDRPSACRRCER